MEDRQSCSKHKWCPVQLELRTQEGAIIIELDGPLHPFPRRKRRQSLTRKRCRTLLRTDGRASSGRFAAPQSGRRQLTVVCWEHASAAMVRNRLLAVPASLVQTIGSNAASRAITHVESEHRRYANAHGA